MKRNWFAWIGVLTLIAGSALGSVVPAASQPSVRPDMAQQVAVAKGKSPAVPERRLPETVTAWLGGISETAVFAAVAAALLLIGVLGRRTAV